MITTLLLLAWAAGVVFGWQIGCWHTEEAATRRHATALDRAICDQYDWATEEPDQ